jgi:predicted nucleic acid-binding protein
MPNKYYNLATYQFVSTDTLILDTNIWLYLFSPNAGLTSSSIWTQKYSGSYRKIIHAHSKVLIDATILSEYLNQCARIEFNAHNEHPKKEWYKTFKKFRESPHYLPIANKIMQDASKIIIRCEQVDTLFSQYDITKILDNYSKAQCDFNDSLLLEMCKRYRCKIITNDLDFGSVDYNVDILTHNKKLLQRNSHSN